MLNNGKKRKRRKLSQEILGLFIITVAIALFFFGFLSVTADSIVLSYCEAKDIILTEMMEWSIDFWIKNISFVAAVLLFVILFLFLSGQKLAYLKEIIRGIEALRTHRMDYQIKLEGNNELTELAESINFLSKTERELQLKETLMREEKEGLIRALSHDIRTPLTAILSYSEYMEQKEKICDQEMKAYILLMEQKAQQIKCLTDRLLDGGRVLEKIENGKLLMEQLTEEWETALEDKFICQTNLMECPEFSGEFDIQELRRVFDNLVSNVEKYADADKSVSLKIYAADNHLLIEQKNACRRVMEKVESFKIGLGSIKKIAEHYGGHIDVELTEEEFAITITLMELK